MIVRGVQPGQGRVVIHLFNDETSWAARMADAQGWVYKQAFLEAGGDSQAKAPAVEAMHTFDDLEYGAYAVLAFQDRNSNGRLDRAPDGRASEPVGESGRDTTDPAEPTWSSAHADLVGAGLQIEVALRDPRPDPAALRPGGTERPRAR